MKLRFPPLLLPLCVLSLFLGVRAKAAVALPSHVKASLVSADASVQPGKPLTVALRLVHNPKWHTYWVNPGTGLATSIEWKLPPGWQAGEIQWPAPRLLKDSQGNIVGNGYEGELFLPVTLTLPADLPPGRNVLVAGTADWLMCEDVCIPGNASLSLELPVAATPPSPDSNYGEKIRATLAGLPRADPAWKVAASRTGKTVTLHLTPAQPGGHAPKDVHFFSRDGLIAYDQPQTVKPDGRGGVILTLPVAADGPAEVKKLIGVATSENGWLPDNVLRGLVVDVDFGPPLAAATPTAAGTTAAASGSSFAGTLLLAFLGGLILNLMPCVFPVLGIKILGFVNQSGSDRGKVVAHGLVFTLGVLLSFWALAAVLTILRAAGEDLGWGFQLQYPPFVFVLAVLLLVFALNLSGVFEFGLGATAIGSNLQTKSGYAGSFFTGVLATVVATPCSAPFLAPALGAAFAVEGVERFGLFTAIAIGLSAPYLLLSIFPQAVNLLPRPGAWMETFKQFMAFPLYATVGLLIWVLLGQITAESQLTTLLGFVVVAMAVWFYGRWHAPGARPARARFGTIALVLVGALGVWLGWPREATDQPAAGIAGEAGAAPGIVWQEWSPEAVAKLRADGRTVYVDFTARWCFTCQTNKKLVFGSNEVLREFAARNIATLKADWTKRDARITAELARYNRSAVPFNLIWAPGRDEPVILPEVLTAGIVLDALATLPSNGPSRSSTPNARPAARASVP